MHAERSSPALVTPARSQARPRAMHRKKTDRWPFEATWRMSLEALFPNISTQDTEQLYEHLSQFSPLPLDTVIAGANIMQRTNTVLTRQQREYLCRTAAYMHQVRLNMKPAPTQKLPEKAYTPHSCEWSTHSTRTGPPKPPIQGALGSPML